MGNNPEMPSSVPALPLPAAPFTLETAYRLGLDANTLRSSSAVHISRGLYRPPDWSFELEDAARALSEISPGAWISHTTAARLHCLVLPARLADAAELHLSKPRSLPEVRRKGIVGHKVLVREDEIETVDGIRMTTRSRTWLDMARRLSLHELVCMGDQLIRVPREHFEGRSEPFDTLNGLRILVAHHPNFQGIARAREALDLMRVGADSAPETMLRLAMGDAGLAQPETQIMLRPGDSKSPSADLGYRRRHVAIQYDGGHHLTEDQRFSDKRRDKAFETAGWNVLIFDKDDLADGFEKAVVMIKKALHKGYLDHPEASGFVDRLV